MQTAFHKHGIVGQVVYGLEKCEVRFRSGQLVARVRFCLLESSRSIAKASLSVMILKSLFLYSLFITRPCFTRKATPPVQSVEF